MLKRICDICGCEVQAYDKTHKTAWFKVIDELHDNEADICKECLEKIVRFVGRE